MSTIFRKKGITKINQFDSNLNYLAVTNFSLISKDLFVLTLHTKSIYDDKTSSDGIRILITRFYPRGVKKERFDLWIRDASPTPNLLKEYKKGLIVWPEFSKRFRKQLTSLEESKAAIDRLAELSKSADITLLCYEREGENCHRTIVKSRLENLLKKKHARTV